MPQRLEPTYREALAAAWRFVSAHTFLWLLGALLVVLGEFGFISFVGRLWRTFLNGVSAADFWWLPTTFRGLTVATYVPSLDSLTLLLILAGFGALLVAAAVIAQGAVMSAAVTFFRTKKTPGLAKSWHKGAERFWHLFGVKAAENIFLTFLSFIIIAIWSVLPTDVFLFALIRGVILVAAVLGGVAISTLSVFASAYIVDKNYSITEAAREGWSLFREHVLVSVEISMILLALTGFVVAAVCVAAYVVTFLGLFMVVLGVAGTDPFVATLGIVFSAFLFVMATALISGFFNAYVLSVWMYCYIHMHRRGISSRLAQVKDQLIGIA